MATIATRLRGASAGSLAAAIGGAMAGLAVGFAATATPAAALPEIRINERNRVPACVTPERLMRFLASGNSSVRPEFRDIARLYQQHGEANKVRWDYAFYQMIIETNYLKFVNGSGQGDVKPKQNNFAGIGTTGGGVPGDSYPDVSTGVLAQIQHLMAYSGERLDRPIGSRTREKQDEIVQKSKALGRAVTFRDLARRWAVDGRYGTSIEFIATRFRSAHCTGKDAEPAEEATPDTPVASADPRETKAGRKGRDSRERARIAARGKAGLRDPAPFSNQGAAADTATDEKVSGATLAARAIEDGRAEENDRRSGLGVTGGLIGQPKLAERPGGCKVYTASYGGAKNLLIRAIAGGELRFTALQVIDGQEQSLAKSFIRSHAPGGETMGEFETREAALNKAFDLCPTAPRTVD